MEESKEILAQKTNDLKIKHESIKIEMVKILDGIGILENEYKILEEKLYSVEDEYIEIIKKLT